MDSRKQIHIQTDNNADTCIHAHVHIRACWPTDIHTHSWRRERSFDILFHDDDGKLSPLKILLRHSLSSLMQNLWCVPVWFLMIRQIARWHSKLLVIVSGELWLDGRHLQVDYRNRPLSKNEFLAFFTFLEYASNFCLLIYVVYVNLVWFGSMTYQPLLVI